MLKVGRYHPQKIQSSHLKCLYMLVYNIYYIVNSCVFYEGHKFISLWLLGATLFNPFAPGDFAEKRVLKLVEWFSGHCRAIKS